MNIGILDDNTSYSTILKWSLIKYGDNKCTIFNTVTNEIYNEDYDIFFLDVMLDDKESFDFGEELLSRKPNTALVYISSMEHFIYDSIYQNSFFFIRKSNLDQDLDKFFDKYNKRIIDENEVLEFVSRGCKQIILKKDIVFIVSRNNSVTIHTFDQEFVVYKSLVQTYALLNHIKFYKLNSYVVVNFDHVKVLNIHSIVFDNQEEVRFTRNSKTPFMEAYTKYKRGKLWNGY